MKSLSSKENRRNSWRNHRKTIKTSRRPDLEGMHTWGIIVIKRGKGRGGRSRILSTNRSYCPTSTRRGSPHLEKTTGTRRGEHGPRAVYVFPGWWSEIYNWAREEFISGSGQSREICIWELFHFFLDETGERVMWTEFWFRFLRGEGGGDWDR